MLCSLLTACTDRSPQRYDSAFLAMGTQVSLSLWAATTQQAAQQSTAIEQQLLQQGVDWYPWTSNPQGELKRLNTALAQGQPLQLSAALADLLQQALELYQRSDGYFDPAIAPMTETWGFADTQSPAIATLPDPAQLSAWQTTRARLADLQLVEGLARSERRDLQLDLGAIAKGYALEQAMQTLQHAGVAAARLNLGGQVALLGTAPPETATHIAIRDPRQPPPFNLATVELLSGESIATSGDYERSAMVQGQRIHHLLDPHTGSPVSHTQAVTVLANNATLADTASTALMAAGPQHWQRIARQMGIREVLRIDATGKIEVTAALYARLKWQPQIKTTRIQQINL